MAEDIDDVPEDYMSASDQTTTSEFSVAGPEPEQRTDAATSELARPPRYRPYRLRVRLRIPLDYQ